MTRVARATTLLCGDGVAHAAIQLWEHTLLEEVVYCGRLMKRYSAYKTKFGVLDAEQTAMHMHIDWPHAAH